MMLSLIVPVCNEEATLEASFNKIKKAVSRLGKYEIIIADDGSTDNTKRVADSITAKERHVKHLYSKKRLGKGLALKRSFKATKGDIIIFTDADLATDIRHIRDMVKEIRNGADICIGSRYMPGVKIKRGLMRGFASNGYVSLVRIFFNTNITDFQCGFKAFSKKAIPVVLKARDNSWFWDTEMLLRAERRGMKISQIAVRWRASKNSKVNILKTSTYLFYKLLRLRASLL